MVGDYMIIFSWIYSSIYIYSYICDHTMFLHQRDATGFMMTAWHGKALFIIGLLWGGCVCGVWVCVCVVVEFGGGGRGWWRCTGHGNLERWCYLWFQPEQVVIQTVEWYVECYSYVARHAKITLIFIRLDSVGRHLVWEAFVSAILCMSCLIQTPMF